MIRKFVSKRSGLVSGRRIQPTRFFWKALGRRICTRRSKGYRIYKERIEIGAKEAQEFNQRVQQIQTQFKVKKNKKYFYRKV